MLFRSAPALAVVAVAFTSVLPLAGCGQDDFDVDASVESVVQQGVLTTTTLNATADTHVRGGGDADGHFGAETLLRVEQPGPRKTLVSFDTAALAATLAGKTVVSASLELNVGNAASGFPTAGQNLVAHRMTTAWTEAGASYNCAIDSIPGNWVKNCSGTTAWNLNAAPFPYATAAAATLVQNGKTGWLAFNVTSDVAAIASGAANLGWLVKRENEALAGNITFKSRENSTLKPRLVIVTAGPCGDGTLDAQNNEACDDGNTVNGDGCSAACRVEVCGDGVVNNNNTETCDDGNTVDGDGCSATCQAGVCGDGVKGPSEQCDDGNLTNGDGCSSACVQDRCGDGVVNNAGPSGQLEQCDDGNTQDGDRCSSSCRIESCGDGAVNNAGSEQCDDGNTVDGDGCSACLADRCGDGVVNNAGPGGATEQCDDGNAGNGDGCSSACSVELCGDGLVNNAGPSGPTEQCDDGNTVAGDGCAACVIESCGDGVINNAGPAGATELCDDGNLNNNDGCSSTCRLEACGDGMVNVSGEACDDGNGVAGDGCTACQLERCGDGVINNAGPAGPTELCDDGNNESGDGCSALCVIERCGDGLINRVGEACDDGNANNGDGCSACRVDRCGDGLVNNASLAGPTELCDDGNTDNDDGCSSACRLEACGDGVVSALEGCDDGNSTSGDGCSSSCQAEACGDGLVNNANGALPTETCDDGNAVDGDGCDAGCHVERCGDGLVNNHVGASIEGCDDGNANNGDGCSASCAVERCGDGVVNNANTVGSTEACDDGNGAAGDGCTACVVDVCGDGVVNNAGHEGCDDGNSVAGDGCTACVVDVCGDGVINNVGSGAAEECDDGNPVNGDGCTGCVVDVCGDGTTNNGEECDDGNDVDGDGCTDCTDDGPPPELTVLLIGNSQLGYFGGTSAMPPDVTEALEAISSEAYGGATHLIVDKAQITGTGCSGFWSAGTTTGTPRALAASGNYDVVILLPGIGEDSADEPCWEQFRDLAEGAGAEFGMMATADVSSRYPLGFDALDAAVRGYALANDLLFVPGGAVWRRVLGETPTSAQKLEMYGGDKSHPGAEGSYLYVLALYGALTGQSVVSLPPDALPLRCKPNQACLSYAALDVCVDNAGAYHCVAQNGALFDGSGKATFIELAEATAYQAAVDAILLER